MKVIATGDVGFMGKHPVKKRGENNLKVCFRFKFGDCYE